MLKIEAFTYWLIVFKVLSGDCLESCKVKGRIQSIQFIEKESESRLYLWLNKKLKEDFLNTVFKRQKNLFIQFLVDVLPEIRLTARADKRVLNGWQGSEHTLKNPTLLLTTV